MKIFGKTLSIIIVVFAIFLVISFIISLMGDKQDLLIYSSDTSTALYLNDDHIGNGVVCIPQLRGDYQIKTDNLNVIVKIMDNSVRAIDKQTETLANGSLIQKISNENSNLYFAPVDCANWTFGGDYQYIIE